MKTRHSAVGVHGPTTILDNNSGGSSLLGAGAGADPDANAGASDRGGGGDDGRAHAISNSFRCQQVLHSYFG